MSTAGDEILEGIVVLDFSAMIAGPYCTRLMADLGARVIKVEPPEGDHMRTRPPVRPDAQGHPRSAYFGQLNAGKQSLSLDLKSPRAHEVVLALAAKADVVVENFRPGVMKRLGLDYPTLSALNPRLVYCSISGFGQSGSWAHRSAYAPVVHASSGYDLAMLDYQGDLARPLKTGVFVADILGGTQAFAGVQSALIRALRTGRGNHVDVSLLDSMLGLMVYETQAVQFPTDEPRPLYQPTRCTDGFVLIAPISQRNFEDLARAIGHADWLTDPRFATIAARGRHWQALMDLIDDWTATRSAADCEAAMQAAGVPCSRYFSVAQARGLPPVRERGRVQMVHDTAGPFEVTNPAFRFSESAAQARDHLPLLGADGPGVLADLLGYDRDQIDRLIGEGVLRVA